jgi:hypothetical protein
MSKYLIRRRNMSEPNHQWVRGLKGISYAARPSGHHLWLSLPPQWNRAEFLPRVLRQGLAVVGEDAIRPSVRRLARGCAQPCRACAGAAMPCRYAEVVNSNRADEGRLTEAPVSRPSVVKSSRQPPLGKHHILVASAIPVAAASLSSSMAETTTPITQRVGPLSAGSWAWRFERRARPSGCKSIVLSNAHQPAVPAMSSSTRSSPQASQNSTRSTV